MARIQAFGRLPAGTIKYTRTLGVTYKTGQTVDIYKPATVRPAVIDLHGGGWQSGDNRDSAPVGIAEKLADAGFAVVNADFVQVTPGNTTPNFRIGGSSDVIQDILDLVLFLRNNAAIHNIEPTAIGALGTSSGGHLVLMAAYLGTPGGSRPDAIIAWSPPCDLSGFVGQPAEGVTKDYMGVDYVGNESVWNAHSPTFRTRVGVPQRIVGSASENTATGGIPRSQYDALQSASLALGVDSTEVIYDGSIHADFRLRMPQEIDWLYQKLGNFPASSRTTVSGRTVVSGRVAV